MRRLNPQIVPYKHSLTSPFVVEGLRIEGKRVRKFFKTEKEGKVWLERKLIELENFGTKALSMTDELRVMAARCQEDLKEHGKTIADATKHYIGYLKQMEKTSSVSDAIKEFLKAKKDDGKADRYLKDLRNRLEVFEIDFGSKKVAEILTSDIDDWLRGLGLAAQTRNNFRRVLNVFFKYSMGRRYCSQNPVEEASKAKVVDKPPEIFSITEITDLLNAAPPAVLPYLTIGAFAGLRAEEICQLDWKEVRLSRNLIEVKAAKSKTARRRLVKILPNLAKWLAPYVKESGKVAPTNIRRWLKDTRTAAKLTKWPANGLRHSFATYHIAHFSDAAQLALQMGHRTTSLIFDHYREVVSPDEAASYWQIEPKIEDNVLSFSSEARA